VRVSKTTRGEVRILNFETCVSFVSSCVRGRLQRVLLYRLIDFSSNKVDIRYKRVDVNKVQNIVPIAVPIPIPDTGYR